MRGILRYSLPLLLAALMFYVLRNADRFIVSQFLSIGDLGRYAMAWTLANIVLTMVFAPIQTSLDVWRYKMHDMPDGAERFADTFRVAMALTGIAAVGLSTVGCDLFALVVAPAFVSSMEYVPWLCGAVVLQAGYSILASAFYVTGATRRWTQLFAVGASAQVIASLALVPLLGVLGAALAIVAANLCLYATTAIFGRKLWQVPYPHRAALASSALVIALPCLRRWLPATDLVATFAIDIATASVFLLALFALRLVRRSDIVMLPRLLWARKVAAGRADDAG